MDGGVCETLLGSKRETAERRVLKEVQKVHAQETHEAMAGKMGAENFPKRPPGSGPAGPFQWPSIALAVFI